MTVLIEYRACCPFCHQLPVWLNPDGPSFHCPDCGATATLENPWSKSEPLRALWAKKLNPK